MVWFRSTQGIGWAAMEVERSNKIRVGLRYIPCVAYLGVFFKQSGILPGILDIEVLGAPPAVQRDGEVPAELGGVLRIRSIQYYAPVPLWQAGHLADQFVKLRRDALDLQQSAVVDVLLAVHRTRVGGEGDVHMVLEGAQRDDRVAVGVTFQLFYQRFTGEVGGRGDRHVDCGGLSGIPLHRDRELEVDRALQIAVRHVEHLPVHDELHPRAVLGHAPYRGLALPARHQRPHGVGKLQQAEERGPVKTIFSGKQRIVQPSRQLRASSDCTRQMPGENAIWTCSAWKSNWILAMEARAASWHARCRPCQHARQLSASSGSAEGGGHSRRSTSGLVAEKAMLLATNTVRPNVRVGTANRPSRQRQMADCNASGCAVKAEGAESKQVNCKRWSIESCVIVKNQQNLQACLYQYLRKCIFRCKIIESRQQKVYIKYTYYRKIKGYHSETKFYCFH
ncbi:hypothetical protein SS50377_26065 [Spironucleus salmonicida]|uniref:Uncharacterized protein n=1 Tax=Spironucleus salmonicida TaxID=348837 RepID=A0A9P8LPH2_9EUKA|nr:hypothetical protein SS50377_26065 [Spironucleus salmonicida]